MRVVFKKNDKFKLIVDIRFANQFIVASKFQYEDLRLVQQMIWPGDYMILMDLADRFHYVKVHLRSKELLGFTGRKQSYMYNIPALWNEPVPICIHKDHEYQGSSLHG